MVAQTADAEIITIIKIHTRRRREALETIRLSVSTDGGAEGSAVSAARAYLDTWRVVQADEIRGKISALRAASPDQGTPGTSPASPASSNSQHSYIEIVDAWRHANATRLAAMPLAELRIKHLATRVLRNVPDLLASLNELDDADMTKALIAANTALHILKDDLKGYDNDQLITDMLDRPRLDLPTFSQALLDEIDAEDSDGDAMFPSIIQPPQPVRTNLQWTHATADAIELAIRTYCQKHNWAVLGQHFGAVLGPLADDIWPAIMNDKDAIRSGLTPETGVAISALKSSVVSDHTDLPENAVAWFEAMQLWLEDHDQRELPPPVMRRIAEEFKVDLLQFAPQPQATGA